MFTGRITGTSTEGTTIPITSVLSTNSKVINDNGVLSIRKEGLYSINGYLTVTGVAGTVNLVVMNNGAERQEMSVTLAETTDVATIPIFDAFRVLSDDLPNVVTITLQVSETGLTMTGFVAVEYLQ